MKVRVIGCHGGVAPGYQTTCYQINDDFLVDCGSVSSKLTTKEQAAITHIFITHPHLDHVKDICFLLENTFSPHRTPLTLLSTAAILKDIHDHLLNDVLWPDFSKISLLRDTPKPALKFSAVETESTVEIDRIRIRPFKVNHPGHAVGYVLDDGQAQLIFTGDSGPCPQIWKEVQGCHNLKALFTEISFPSRMGGLARASGHFTLRQLLTELESLQRPELPVYISHFKPLFLNELMEEFHRTAPEQLKLMHEDDTLEFS